MDEVASIFRRYEEIRPRLPRAPALPPARDVGSLLDIADAADAFVFDAFGVLNVGETPIPGAAERLDQLRARGRAIRILSNAASQDHDRAVEKFRRLGMDVAPEEIVTSRDATLAALAALGPEQGQGPEEGPEPEKAQEQEQEQEQEREQGLGLWGCIAAPGDALSDIPAPTLRLADEPSAYDRVDGILFLSTADWSEARQRMLAQALERRPRPVLIANADLVAPREGGFTLEPGHYGHLLVDRGIPDVRFFGKPFPEAYRMIEASLPGIAPGRIAMCGDSLHTDILGAAARGWQTVLVTRDGLFAGEDTAPYCAASGIHPTWRLARI